MYSSNLRVPFQQCRRRGAGRRLFLPVKLQIAEYILRFTDGARERYQVAYTASIQVEKCGQCWRYRGHVSRQVSIYNRAGERFEKAGVDRRVELAPNTGRNAVANWQSWREYTPKSGSSFSGDAFEEIVQWFTGAFTQSMIADKRRVEGRFRHMYRHLEAISEID